MSKRPPFHTGHLLYDIATQATTPRASDGVERQSPGGSWSKTPGPPLGVSCAHWWTPGGLASCSFGSCLAQGGNSDALLSRPGASGGREDSWSFLQKKEAGGSLPKLAEAPLGSDFGQACIWGRAGTSHKLPRSLSFHVGYLSPCPAVWVLGSCQ